MKNIFKFPVLIAIAAVIAFSMSACNQDPGDDKVPKTLVITDIPDTDSDGNQLKGKQITAALCRNSNKSSIEINALNQADSSATVTIPLLSGNQNKKGGNFTGTGEYYIFLFFDVTDTKSDINDDVAYAYGGGGNNPVLYTITDRTTTISWSEFKKQQ